MRACQLSVTRGCLRRCAGTRCLLYWRRRHSAAAGSLGCGRSTENDDISVENQSGPVLRGGLEGPEWAAARAAVAAVALSARGAGMASAAAVLIGSAAAARAAAQAGARAAAAAAAPSAKGAGITGAAAVVIGTAAAARAAAPGGAELRNTRRKARRREGRKGKERGATDGLGRGAPILKPWLRRRCGCSVAQLPCKDHDRIRRTKESAKSTH